MLPNQAQKSAITRRIEALPSQTCRLKTAGYVFPADYTMIPPRNTQVSLTSVTGRVRQYNSTRSKQNNRRHRCQRASNSWQPSVSWPLCQHVRPASPTKSSWLLSQSPFQLSLRIQASTSNQISEQACAPVPPQPCATLGGPFDRRAV